MKKLLCLLAAVSLAAVALAVCGGDPEPTATPEPPPPTPTATATAVPTPIPTSNLTDVISPDADVPSQGSLSPECPRDGTLDSAAAIATCSIFAAQQVESFSFGATMDLLALLPAGEEGGNEGSIRLNGSIVRPDRLQYRISLGPESTGLYISGITIGSDTYVQDPESGLWFKGTPADDDLLFSLQLVGMLMLPADPSVSQNSSVELDDDSMSYIIVSGQPTQGGEAGFPSFQYVTVTRVVGFGDFLTREVRVSSEGWGGSLLDLIIISYQGYNEAVAIEPPVDYIPLPDEAMDGWPP